jgi:hypothetical protein
MGRRDLAHLPDQVGEPERSSGRVGVQHPHRPVAKPCWLLPLLCWQRPSCASHAAHSGPRAVSRSSSVIPGLHWAAVGPGTRVAAGG